MPASVPHTPDLRLVAAARRGDREAWDQLLQGIQLPLYAYVAELIRDRDLAFDLIQESFVNAVHHIGSLREDDRFYSWLFGIAHQRCLAHLRRHQRYCERFESETELDQESFKDENLDSPLEVLEQTEEASRFFALLERLPEHHRAVLLLHVLEDFSLEDIAHITDVPLGTVKSRLHHAKRALRSLVEETP